MRGRDGTSLITKIVLSCVLVTKTWFELVIAYITHLQVVTTINYNTVPDFYTTKHFTLISSIYLHCSSRIYHTGTYKSQSHTSNITVLSTYKTFKSLIKSSQADLLYSSATIIHS
jgi:hypothetical protein